MNDPKTYIVAGYPRSGTTMMMRALEEGGITPLYTNEKTREWGEGRGKTLTREEVEGKAIKRFGADCLDTIPHEVGRFMVVFMTRDPKARARASEGAPPADTGIGKAVLANRLANTQTDLARLSQSSRVERLIVVDYDDMVDDPLHYMGILYASGWDFTFRHAAKVIDPILRHVKRGEDVKSGEVADRRRMYKHHAGVRVAKKQIIEG